MDQFSSTQNGKPIDQAKMSWYLNQLAKLSRYFFVAESPGNRVIGYGTARIEGTNTTAKGCIVTHVAVYEPYYLSAEIATMLVDKLDETSDMYDAVDCLNIMPSTNLTHIGLEEMLKGSRYVNHFKVLQKIQHQKKRLAMMNRIKAAHEKFGAAEATTFRGMKN